VMLPDARYLVQPPDFFQPCGISAMACTPLLKFSAYIHYNLKSYMIRKDHSLPRPCSAGGSRVVIDPA
jgi:hypothetical protein